jgi:RNA polymerase sigma-70 factor (ECF subfamily)
MDALSPTQSLDDVNLVRRAQGGDRAAFAVLVERHYTLVHGCGYRRLGNRADAEDVAQDVMAKFGRAIFALKEPAALRGFLLKLTINAVTDLFRKRKRDSTGSASYLVDPSTANEPADATEARFDALWTAVRQLPQQQRDAVLLVYADGASHREAAVALGCAEATISYHVHAARKRLKELLKEDAQ